MSALPIEDCWCSIIEVRKTEDRGVAMFAKAFIPTGTLLIREHAIVYKKMTGDVEETQAKLVELLQKHIGNNPKSARDVLSLYSGQESSSPEAGMADSSYRLLESIVKYNAFGSTFNLQTTVAIWLRASRMNHACISNCFRRFDEDVITVIAKRDIAAGEEIQISYILGSESFEFRQHYTSTLGFRCSCALCISEQDVSYDQRQVRQRILAAYHEEVVPQIDQRGELTAADRIQLRTTTSRVLQFIIDSYTSSGQNLYWYDIWSPGSALAVLEIEADLLDDALVTLQVLVSKCNDHEEGAIRLYTMVAAVQVRTGLLSGAMNNFALSAQTWLVCNPCGAFRSYWTETSDCIATYAGLASSEIARLEDAVGHVFEHVGKMSHPSSARA